MQLLTASKSLMGIKDATGRYRMAEGNLLPQFTSTRRAGSPVSPTHAEPVKSATVPLIENQSMAKPEAKPKKTFIKPMLFQARENILRGERSVLAICRRACASVMTALKKINPLSYWKGRQPRAKAEKIKPNTAAVQGELSLDKVKVVRNDLSDTDLEIVPVTNPAQSKAPEPVSVLLNQRAPIETSWGRLTSRILGAGQTPF